MKIKILLIIAKNNIKLLPLKVLKQKNKDAIQKFSLILIFSQLSVLLQELMNQILLDKNYANHRKVILIYWKAQFYKQRIFNLKTLIMIVKKNTKYNNLNVIITKKKRENILWKMIQLEHITVQNVQLILPAKDSKQ